MKRLFFVCLLVVIVSSFFSGMSYAGSSKTWSNIGKGLAIYEGAKVLTGSQGNILDDVTGGLRPRNDSSQQSQGPTYQDGYDDGYKSGYDTGFNAGFRRGIEQK